MHDEFPAVSEFIQSIFEQLKEEKTELTVGFSEAMVKADSEEVKNAFNRMNMNAG